MPPKKKPTFGVGRKIKGPPVIQQKKKTVKYQKVPWQLMRKAKKLGVTPETILQQEFPVSDGSKHQAFEKQTEDKKCQPQMEMQTKNDQWAGRTSGSLFAPTLSQSSWGTDLRENSQNNQMMGQYKESQQKQTGMQNNRVPGQFKENPQMDSWTQRNQTNQFKESSQIQSWKQNNWGTGQYKENPQMDNWTQNDRATGQYKDSPQEDTWTQNNQGTDKLKENPQNNQGTGQDDRAQNDQCKGSHQTDTWSQNDQYKGSHQTDTWSQNDQYKGGHQTDTWSQNDQYKGSHQTDTWSQNDQYKGSYQTNTWSQNDQYKGSHQTDTWPQNDQYKDSYQMDPWSQSDQYKGSYQMDPWSQSDQYKGSYQMDTWSHNRGTGNYRDSAKLQPSTYNSWGTGQTWSHFKDSSKMQTSTKDEWVTDSFREKQPESWSENNQGTGYYRGNLEMQPWTQSNRMTGQSWNQSNRGTGYYRDGQEDDWPSNSRLTGQYTCTERRQLETWAQNDHVTGQITERRLLDSWARSSRMSDQYMETWTQNSLLPDPIMDMDPWDPSSSLMSNYANMPGSKALSTVQQSPGYKEWVRKERFRRLALNPTFGLKMLKRMGWRPGEGLGKEKKGMIEPLMPYMEMEPGYGPNPASLYASQLVPKPPKIIRPKDLVGKHPVSALIELCTNRSWPAPEFQVTTNEAPDHKKTYLMKVRVNGREFVPSKECPTKKEAKALAAELCLQAIGMLPKKRPVPPR